MTTWTWERRSSQETSTTASPAATSSTAGATGAKTTRSRASDPPGERKPSPRMGLVQAAAIGADLALGILSNDYTKAHGMDGPCSVASDWVPFHEQASKRRVDLGSHAQGCPQH